MVVAHNELGLMSKLPPETLIAISEFVANPRSRESMFEIVKMTHICQYWRSTLISCPHLWSSIFVKNDHKDFVAACLERSRELPLAIFLSSKHCHERDYPDCTCIPQSESSSGKEINKKNPCRYHTTINPLLNVDHTQRIRKLDVRLAIHDSSWNGPDQDFKEALDRLGLFAFPVPSLESLSFNADPMIEADDHAHWVFPRDLFGWATSPPTRLRHLTLRCCYGGPIQAVRNLTSFELAGVEDDFDPIELTQRSFLPFISGSPSLVSLTLSHCIFPSLGRLSQVTPVKLPKLKTLRLRDIFQLPGLTGLIEVPALKTLSSLRISTRKEESRWPHVVYLQLRAEGDDGFQLFCDVPNNDELTSERLSLIHNADPGPAFVRFEGVDLDAGGSYEMEISHLPLFLNTTVLEIGASFAHLWYRTFWKDVENIGPQLTTLRLEVIEGISPVVATSVKEFVKARLEKGMPLKKLERMEFDAMSEESEEKAKRLWEEFRAGLDIDQYLIPK